MNLQPWRGGGRLLSLSAAAAAAGLGLTLVGGFLDPRRALHAYLVAFVYWIGIALGALILLAALHASKARWPVVLRRFLEAVPATLPLFALLFVPIVLGMGHLFLWTQPLSTLEPGLVHAVEHKLPWLNTPFFLLRAAFYFAFWIAVASLLRAWSTRQDATGGTAFTVRQRWLGAGSLPFLALTMTFAAFDWMMSLDPRFFSTIFGVYWFAGSFQGAFAVTIVAGALGRGEKDLFAAHMNADHFHALGKFLLAFTAFWAYVAFSQFMLIWIANIPEEVPWTLVRSSRGWGAVGIGLAALHFLVPFFLLLSRDLKRNPRALALVAGWQLLMHWLDVYWLVMPRLHPDGPAPGWVDLTAFVGVGAAAVAFTLWRLRGVVTVPLRDPYLEDSLRYQPQ
jgi:hypothetical protein